jgi:hypothetical protein
MRRPKRLKFKPAHTKLKKFVKWTADILVGAKVAVVAIKSFQDSLIKFGEAAKPKPPKFTTFQGGEKVITVKGRFTNLSAENMEALRRLSQERPRGHSFSDN